MKYRRNNKLNERILFTDKAGDHGANKQGTDELEAWWIYVWENHLSSRVKNAVRFYDGHAGNVVFKNGAIVETRLIRHKRGRNIFMFSGGDRELAATNAHPAVRKYEKGNRPELKNVNPFLEQGMRNISLSSGYDGMLDDLNYHLRPFLTHQTEFDTATIDMFEQFMPGFIDPVDHGVFHVGDAPTTNVFAQTGSAMAGEGRWFFCQPPFDFVPLGDVLSPTFEGAVSASQGMQDEFDGDIFGADDTFSNFEAGDERFVVNEPKLNTFSNAVEATDYILQKASPYLTRVAKDGSMRHPQKLFGSNFNVRHTKYLSPVSAYEVWDIGGRWDPRSDDEYDKKMFPSPVRTFENKKRLSRNDIQKMIYEELKNYDL